MFKLLPVLLVFAAQAARAEVTPILTFKAFPEDLNVLISGANTEHDDLVVGCFDCLAWADASVFIVTAPGSTVDPGGCIDLNGDGVCYTFHADIARYIPDLWGTVFSGSILSESGNEFSGGGTVRGMLNVDIAYAYGVTAGPWYGSFTKQDSMMLDSMTLRPVPEPYSILLFASALLVVGVRSRGFLTRSAR